LAGLDLVIRARGSRFEITLDGQPVEPAIRAEEIGELASRLSARPDVRAGLLELQRRAAKAGDLVAEGRDMGTVVFPGAQVKVFLTASDTERARRRRLQLEAQGQHVDFNEILDDMRRRDKRDSTRAASPLASADDAQVVDTSDLSQTEVVEHLLSIVRQRGYIE
jgi:cytidylate kinase